jgi:hypothetical protein
VKMHVDQFTGGIANLPPRRRTIVDALLSLDRCPCISTFERGAPWLEKLIRDMERRGFIEDRGGEYPYRRYAITSAGRGVLALAKEEDEK